VWFVLDELASLHRLPQLTTAIYEHRKAGNNVVLCFQGRSQLEAIYGRLALGLGYRQTRNGGGLASRRLSPLLDLESAAGPTRTTGHLP
jgi:hypothetical protein